jgi:hypothetical protein
MIRFTADCEICETSTSDPTVVIRKSGRAYYVCSFPCVIELQNKIGRDEIKGIVR